MSGRPQVRDDAVPALARGVKLRFDKARDAWVLLAPEKVLMPDQIAVEILKRCDRKAAVRAIVDDLAVGVSADRDQVAADVHRSYRTWPTRACSGSDAWVGGLSSASTTTWPNATNSPRRGEVRRHARPTVRTGGGV